jgi:pimeloyl-ACP methyl ester carboxylesterase
MLLGGERMSVLERIEWGRHGPRVVLVHGDVFDAPAIFAAMEPLAAHHRLVLVNRRGFGASPAVDGKDFDVDAGDLEEVLVEEPSHLVGQSCGGVASLIAAAQVPGSVQSLIVFEPPAFGLVADDPEVRRLIDSIRAMLTVDPPPDEFLRSFAALLGADPSHLPTPLPESLFRAARVQMHGRWPWEAVIPLEALAAATWPKLVVSGGHSRIFDLGCDVLQRQLPARREVFRGAGHSIPRLGDPVNKCLARLWASSIN